INQTVDFGINRCGARSNRLTDPFEAAGDQTDRRQLTKGSFHMFLGLRDIRFAKGRFALMATVIGLITMLLVLLSGLTAGLGNQSTSAIADLPAKSVVFNTPKDAKPSFTESVISPAQLATWQEKFGS